MFGGEQNRSLTNKIIIPPKFAQAGMCAVLVILGNHFSDLILFIYLKPNSNGKMKVTITVHTT